jgi:soluble lytic murein transglycosylase
MQWSWFRGVLIWLAILLPMDSYALDGFEPANNDAQILFSQARDAYQSKNDMALANYLQTLQARHYVLAPYVDYWLMLLHLNQSDTPVVRDFLSRYAEYPFSDRLRGEWIKILGKRQDWQTLLDEYPNFKRDDIAVTCYALEARAASGDSNALADGLAVWLSANEQASNCNSLFDRMQKVNILTEAQMFARLRLALQENKITLAKAILIRMQRTDLAIYTLLDKAVENPQQLLEKRSVSYKTTLGRAFNLYAMERLARAQPEYALEFWQTNLDSYTTDDQDYFWGRLALHAARRNAPEALDYFARIKAGVKAMDKDQLAWRVRAALRARNWAVVQANIQDMPSSQQDEAAWRYWLGRALKEQKQVAAANAILVPLAKERSYYGLLAEEELGDVMSGVPAIYKPNDKDFAAVLAVPAIQRAIELQRFDMRTEARAEWNLGIKDFDDRLILTAAEFAMRQEWYDLAINTADKTKLTHDFALRYPAPYRERMQQFAREQALDEAWVYGITRQESRFMHYAKSGVGASGLMQVMPATAMWIAKRLGLGNYRDDMIHQLDTNIQMGTYYLRYTLDLMGGQTLVATAAYNAGPSRAKRWAPQQPLEGAIYAETIPFAETRGYTQKVMSNAYFYAHRLGAKVQSLKQRLGMVSASNEPPATDDSE